MAYQQQNRSTQQPKKRNICLCTKQRLNFGGQKSNKKNGSYPIILKSQWNQKPRNKSIITLYRKTRKNWKNKNTKSLFAPTKELTNTWEYLFGKGDACAGGPCRENFYINKLQKVKDNSNDKTDKILAKLPKNSHVCKCNEHGQLQNCDVNENAAKDKKSFKEKLFCKCKAKDKDYITVKTVGEKENVIVKKERKPFKNKHVCKCIENDSMNSHNHATDIKNTEMVKKSVENIICKCKTENKLKPIKTPRHSMVTKKQKAKVGYIGYGDQFLESTKPKTHILNENTPRGINAGDQTGEHVFEMKVDLQNMHIINAEEINKVRTSGKLQSRRSCICPSRRGKICQKGICEKALKNKQTNFDCKCKIKKKPKECTDLTCDSNLIMNIRKKSVIDRNPLFEVKLDPGDMKIVNMNEIKEIFEKQKHEICPSGICRSRGNINCKCIKNKLSPAITRCTERTCRTEGRGYLTHMCSKVFSNTGSYKLSNICSKRLRMFNVREDGKVKPVIHRRDGLNINFTRDHRKKQNSHKQKDAEPKITQGKSKNNNKVNKTEQLKQENNAKKRRKSNKSYFNEFILKCLHRKRVRCKKRMMEEEKALNVAEKNAIKENRRILRKKNMETNDPQWNCLTKLIAGLLNLIVHAIKKIVVGIWTTITNPIRTLVYIKRRVNDPNGTITKIFGWVQRTYGDTTSKMSQKIKNVNTLNIIADTIEDTNLFNTFADKGQTKEEKALYEKRRKLRKQRIDRRERDVQADCRHMLLKTMRRHPWLCCYYICPDLYPQCLNLRNFMKSFFNIIIFLLAFLCWTPCIAAFELGRAILCCLL